MRVTTNHTFEELSSIFGAVSCSVDVEVFWELHDDGEGASVEGWNIVEGTLEVWRDGEKMDLSQHGDNFRQAVILGLESEIDDRVYRLSDDCAFEELEEQQQAAEDSYWDTRMQELRG